MKKTRGNRWLLSLMSCSVLSVISVGTALAQSGGYPSKPIKIIVPYVAGGPSDLFARAVGQLLTEAWGQPAIVDNRPGASGNVGVLAAVRSPADGYTLTTVSIAFAVSPAMDSRLGYDPVKDLAPISLLAVINNLLVVNPNLPVKSVKELIVLAQRSPGTMTYASAGAGSPAHLAHELLNRSGKVAMVHVPYKGSAPALVDLLGGHVFTYFSGMPPAMPHVRAGKLRGLAVSTAQRSQAAPEIPAVAETISGFDVPTWFSLLAPAGTPRDIVLKLNAEAVKSLNDPSVKPKLAALGAETSSMGADEVATYLEREVAKYARIVKESGARVE